MLKADFLFPYVGIENHVNYVYHAERELTPDEVFGIAALFNSSLIDRYFRTISGNTQVNATEIRAMNFPDLKALARIGKQVKGNTADAEAVVLKELGVTGSLRSCLVGVPRSRVGYSAPKVRLSRSPGLGGTPTSPWEW